MRNVLDLSSFNSSYKGTQDYNLYQENMDSEKAQIICPKIWMSAEIYNTF